MRISEAVALRWDDVDFERRVLRVYRCDKREGEGAPPRLADGGWKHARCISAGPGLSFPTWEWDITTQRQP
jgi:hypothetical protein